MPSHVEFVIIFHAVASSQDTVRLKCSIYECAYMGVCGLIVIVCLESLSAQKHTLITYQQPSIVCVTKVNITR